jgi:hypothetical protein
MHAMTLIRPTLQPLDATRVAARSAIDTRLAEKLHPSQPAVSSKPGGLEDVPHRRLFGTLVNRSNRRRPDAISSATLKRSAASCTDPGR